MPACESGDTFTVDEIKLVEKQTSPPDYLTEAELITLMEKHGIGARKNSLYRMSHQRLETGGVSGAAFFYLP